MKVFVRDRLTPLLALACAAAVFFAAALDEPDATVVAAAAPAQRAR